MQIFSSDTALTWGELDLPLFGISNDWHGTPLDPPLAFSLARDEFNLWFIATRQTTATIHPVAIPGKFTPELWKYDVAELFLADAETGEYLEFNLAPNGAWWAYKFSAPRVPSPHQPDFHSSVTTYADDRDPATWLAALVIPVAFLEREIGLGTGTTGNAAFIQNSPKQVFLTAENLPGSKPDFHQPANFTVLKPAKIPIC